MDLFERAVAAVLGVEKGYVNDPADRGGETKFGISKRQYPHLDIQNLTWPEAKAIYRRDYWDLLRCGDMPWPVALSVFDAAVHHGQPTAARLLQGAVGARADGVVGPVTLGRLAKLAPVDVASEFTAQRLAAMPGMPTWKEHGLGWCRRVMHIAILAVS